jgi:tetratricopeptide (TPR) repeat protein
MPPNYLEVWLSGRNLNAQQVIELEQKLLVNPIDQLSRIALMGYYPKYALWKRAAREKALGHELWFIRNEPTHPRLRFPLCSRIACADDDLYEIGKSAWLEHVDDDCDDASILSRAASFFSMRDKQRAAELIERARTIEPSNPRHLDDLASLYSLGLNGDYDRSWLQRAFEVHGELLASKPDDIRQLAAFAGVAEKVGEYDLAREAALKILQVVKPTDRAAIHQAHSVLGLIYLHT